MTDKEDPKAKLWSLIKEIKTALFVTHDTEGRLRARPMATQKTSTDNKVFDGYLWFMTSAATGKIEELKKNPDVLLNYANADDNAFATVAGKAEVLRDQAKINEFWDELCYTWFPKGKEDPDITLIRVSPESAEYWDANSNAVIFAYGYLKARLTGEAPHPGENEKVTFAA